MTTDATDWDTRGQAAHLGRITLTHQDTEVDTRITTNQHGATTWWADGTTSYVLHFRSGHTHGWTIADEADTVIQAVDSLRNGEHFGADRLHNVLRDVRRLRTRLEALEAELILYSRETDPQGKAKLSLRDIAEELGLHHSTVAERLQRMLSGDMPAWRHWLVQGTDRENLHADSTDQEV